MDNKFYILASKRNGTLYRCKNNLVKQVCDHKLKVAEGFTEKDDTANAAITRENK